jgi:hypothetical protein
MVLMRVGVNSTYGRKDGNLSSSSSKFSSVPVPSTPRTEGEILQSSNLKIFSCSVVGEGGFGCVFKGWIDEHSFAPVKPGTGIVIAVKRLNQEGFQGHKEWLVSFISTLLWLLCISSYLSEILSLFVEP